MPSALCSDGYLAGCDAQRAEDLQRAFDDPTLAAVLCVRGGYGAARLLPRLDLDAMAASGKLFMGYSDITALHFALNLRGLPTAHSPMVVSFEHDKVPWVAESFLSVLRGGGNLSERAPAGNVLVGGTARGVVAGGCLTLTTDSLGTPHAFDGSGKIVLIEDVGEEDYRVDGNLTHLLNSGALDGARGIVVGEMTGTNERKTERETVPWQQIVSERLGGLGIPIITNYPFGHVDNMLTLPLGIEATLDADAGTLTYTSPLAYLGSE